MNGNFTPKKGPKNLLYCVSKTLVRRDPIYCCWSIKRWGLCSAMGSSGFYKTGFQ